jgi:predicted HAD superfamily Cof-like phosphohydrolase
MDDKDLLLQIPTWGLFALLTMNLVFRFLAKQKEHDAKKLSSDAGLSQPPSPEEIAAVIRDQQERHEILELMRSQSTTHSRLAEALEQVASAQERIAKTQDRQAHLLERQIRRTRALAEATAANQQALVQLRADMTPIPARRE